MNTTNNDEILGVAAGGRRPEEGGEQGADATPTVISSAVEVSCFEDLLGASPKIK